MVYSAIDVVNLVNILTYPKPKSDSKDLSKLENGNKQVRHVILSTLTNELFDVYCQYKVPKEIWDALTKKYIVEDAGIQKYVIGNFRKFQMTKDRCDAPKPWGSVDQLSTHENTTLGNRTPKF